MRDLIKKICPQRVTLSTILTTAFHRAFPRYYLLISHTIFLSIIFSIFLTFLTNFLYIWFFLANFTIFLLPPQILENNLILAPNFNFKTFDDSGYLNLRWMYLIDCKYFILIHDILSGFYKSRIFPWHYMLTCKAKKNSLTLESIPLATYVNL